TSSPTARPPRRPWHRCAPCGAEPWRRCARSSFSESSRTGFKRRNGVFSPKACTARGGTVATAPVLNGYQSGTGFFDEMVAADLSRAHYQKFRDLFAAVAREDFDQRRHAVDLAFLRQGITFNVYGDAEGTERIFPFDLIPRIIPAKEWEHIEAGLTQRITALNLFLHDIYHEQKILKDGVIP